MSLVETRSGKELAEAASRSACPLVVIDPSDLGDSVASDLDGLAVASGGALVLVLDPWPGSGLAEIAREIGATRVIAATTPPPAVMEILRLGGSGSRATAAEPPAGHGTGRRNPSRGKR